MEVTDDRLTGRGGLALFSRYLRRLFLWQLRIAEPEVIVLGIDPMVMDNGEAERRVGVQPTYRKGVRGFAPLQITWGRYGVDAVFRGGSQHGNSGQTAPRAIEHLVHRIRADYREEVPILFRSDSGFMDRELFLVFQALGMGYVCTGKLYADLTARVRRAPAFALSRRGTGVYNSTPSILSKIKPPVTPSPARAGASAPPATPGAWHRPPPTWPTM